MLKRTIRILLAIAALPAFAGPILNSSTLTGTTTVPSGSELSIAAGATLTLSSGITLTIPNSAIGLAALAAGGASANAPLIYNGTAWAASSGLLSIASGKTFTASNTLTVAGTDGSTLNIGTGGTLGTAAYTASSAYQASDAELTLLAGLSLTGNSLKLLRVNAGETGFEFATAGAGSGDVVGPASATDGNVALYDGTTGKLIKNSTIAGSNIATLSGSNAFTGANTMGSVQQPLTVTAATVANQTAYLQVWTGDVALNSSNTATNAMGGFTANAAGSEYANMFGSNGTTSAGVSCGTDTVTIGPILSTGNAVAVVIGGGTAASELRFLEPSGSGTNYGALVAPALAANQTYTLPDASGTMVVTGTAPTLTGTNFTGIPLSTAVSGNLPAANAVSGSQIGHATATTASLVTCSTVMPFDDTVPQNTEGDEVLTLSYTPKSASSTLQITVCGNVGSSTNSSRVVFAVFKDSDASCITGSAGSVWNTSTTGSNMVGYSFTVASGSTSARTYKLRSGPQTGSAYWNGTGGARAFGGAAATSITVKEIAP